MADFRERLLKYNEERFFGQWRLDGATPEEALLGSGSYGSVYAVFREESDSNGRTVRYRAAIKFIAIDDNIKEIRDCPTREGKQAKLNAELRAVRNEIDIMRILEGESNIAYFQNSRIIERRDTELQCWDVLICMEKLVVLNRHWRDLNLTPGSNAHLVNTLFIWKDIISALIVCERNAILHVDVKPQNVFYAPGTDHYKLSDFGASIRGNTFKEGILFGTREYMSPEMFHRKGGDSRADMYSLAVMIYELLNGNALPLQKGNDRAGAWNARLNELKQIPPIKGVPDDVNEVLLRCLDTDPKRRYARCSDVIDAVMALYLKYKGKTTGTARPRKNNWVLPVVIGALAVSALGVGVGIISSSGKDKDEVPAVQPTATVSVAGKLEMTLDATEIIYKPGHAMNIKGSFVLLDNSVHPADLLLFVDGMGWHMTIWEVEGYYVFSADIQLNRTGTFELPVSLHINGNNQPLDTQTLVFVEEAPDTPEPTNTPTLEPTNTPTLEPTNTPTLEPTNTPTLEPTDTPTPEPTNTPTLEPTDTPTPEPEDTPTVAPEVTPEPVEESESAVEETDDESDSDRQQIVNSDYSESEVRNIQQKLIALGILPKGAENGVYDRVTADAVAEFQNWVNQQMGREELAITGEADQMTLVYLDYCQTQGMYAGLVEEAAEDSADDEADPAVVDEDTSNTSDDEASEEESNDEESSEESSTGITDAVGSLLGDMGLWNEDVADSIETEDMEEAAGRFQDWFAGRKGAEERVSDPTPSPEAVEEPTPEPTNTPTLEPTNTPTLEPTETPTPTPAPMPEPVIGLLLDSGIIWDSEGTVISGVITSDTRIDSKALELVVNGEKWDAEIEVSQAGEYAFTAEKVIAEEEIQLEVSARLVTESGEFINSRPVDVVVEVPEPTPTPVPTLKMKLDNDRLVADNSEISFGGTVVVDGDVGAEDLLLSVNGSAVEALWEEGDGGFEFVASLFMDVEGAETLEVKVRVRNNSDIEPASGTIEVVEPEKTPEPTPEPYMPIQLNNVESIESEWIGPNDVLTITGSAEPEEALDVSVNGKLLGTYVAERNGSFAVDILTASLRQGVNTVSVDYSRPPEGEEEFAVSVNARFDFEAPVIDTVDVIDQYVEQLEVSLSDYDVNARVDLLVDGKAVRTCYAESAPEISEDGSAQTVTVVIPDITAISLTAASEIEVVAADAAGNTAKHAVRFSRHLRDIVLDDAETLADAWLTAETEQAISGTAEPNVVLMLTCGDAEAELTVDEGGRFSWKIDPAVLAQGVNTASVRYHKVDGLPVEVESKPVEVQLRFDSLSPELTVYPTRIMQGVRTFKATVAGEPNGWRTDLIVNDKVVAHTEFASDADSCELTIPDTVQLSEDSRIELVAMDPAGNSSSKVIEYVHIDDILVENIEDLQGKVWNSKSKIILNVHSEPNAKLNVKVNDDQFQLTQTKGGSGNLDITARMVSGLNSVYIGYASENGYSDVVYDDNMVEFMIACDLDSPEVVIEPEIITRDTTDIHVKVANETLYGASMVIDGETVWSKDDIQAGVQGGEIVISGIDGMNLKKAKDISITVTDYLNDPFNKVMTYEDISTKVEAFAFTEMTDLGEVNAGETAEVQIWVICNDYDMTEGYITTRLVDAGGTRRNCKFTRQQLDDSQYEQLVANVDADISNYANTAYLITGITIQDDRASGDYVLEMLVETENEKYTFELGTITVQEQQKGSSVSAHYTDFTDAYAVGFDAPISKAFRADSVVLTGWIFNTEEMPAYFERYDVLDNYGRQLYTGYLTEDEFAMYDRADVQKYAPSAELVGMTDEAGFILNADLSHLGLTNGEQYVIQMYTSGDSGAEKASISATVLIDGSAPQITEADLAGIAAAWTPFDRNADPEAITRLQTQLYSYGILDAESVESGVLDANTLLAIADFQTAVNDMYNANLIVIDPNDSNAIIDADTLSWLYDKGL